MSDWLLAGFEDVGWAYGPRWDPYLPARDAWESLDLLFGTYVYERLGGFPAYVDAAQSSVRELQARGIDVSEERAEPLFWDRYLAHLQATGKRPNIRCDPAAPQGAVWNGLRNDQRSLLSVAREVEQPLWEHLRDGLLRGRVQPLHDLLTSVGGIGTKIASFTLRDVALQFELRLSTDRHLLQPIDIWVVRAVELALPQGASKRLEGSQAAIVQACTNQHLDPERVNAGMWYFGQRIAQAPQVVPMLCARPELFRSSVEYHFYEQEGQPASYEEAIGRWRQQFAQRVDAE